MCLYVLLYVYKPYKPLKYVLFCVLFAFLGAIMNFEYYFDKILDFYNVSTIKELSLSIDTGASTISNWKQRNSITALKKKCRELGIYNEIFGDINTNIQNIDTISGGQNAQNIGKNQINSSNSDDFILDEDIQKVLKSALPILDDDDKKEDFIKHIKKWIVENL